MLDANPPRRASISELEGLLKLARQTIYKHVRRADLTADADKRYDVQAVARAIIEHRKQDNRLRGTVQTPELKNRKLQLEADILETKLRQLEQELVPIEAVRKQNRNLAQSVRQRLEAIPERWAAILAADLGAPDQAHRVETLLRDEIRSALEALADQIEQPPETEAEDDAAENQAAR